MFINISIIPCPMIGRLKDYFRSLGQHFFIYSTYQFSNASTTLIFFSLLDGFKLNSDVPVVAQHCKLMLIFRFHFFSQYHTGHFAIGPYLAMDHLGNSFKLITLTQGTFA